MNVLLEIVAVALLLASVVFPPNVAAAVDDIASQAVPQFASQVDEVEFWATAFGP